MMTYLKLLITLSVFLYSGSWNEGRLLRPDIGRIIAEYFHLKYVQHLVYIPCSIQTDDEIARILKIYIEHGFTTNIYKIGNIDDLYLHRSYRTGIIMELLAGDCDSSQEILKSAEEKNLFLTNNYWMLIGYDVGYVRKVLQNIFIPPSSEVISLILDETTDLWMLIDIYKIAPEKSLKVNWITDGNLIESPHNGILLGLRTYGAVIPKRKNFNGIFLKCGTVVQFPDVFTTMDDLRTKYIDTIAKSNFGIAINLREDLNFRFDLIQVDNFGWKKNGSFDGLMGHFERSDIDFGAIAIFMRQDRLGLVDLTGETFNVEARIIFRQPSLSAVSNIFVLPFSKGVWISAFIFLLLITITMLTQLCHPCYKVDMHVLDCFNFAWCALCQQGFPIQIYARSGRILIFTAFITTLFLFTSYSANIVALLQSPSQSIRSIGELITSPLAVGAQDTAYNKIYFKENQNPLVSKLFEKKIKPKGENAYIRPHYGIEKVRTGLFAYQIETQAAYQIVSDSYNEHEKCSLMELEAFKLPTMSIPVRKNFPYKEQFKERLRWQREVGLLKREFWRWFPQKPKCENKVAGFVSVGITECRYAFQIFAIGVLIAIIILILEISYFKMKAYYFLNH